VAALEQLQAPYAELVSGAVALAQQLLGTIAASAAQQAPAAQVGGSTQLLHLVTRACSLRFQGPVSGACQQPLRCFPSSKHLPGVRSCRSQHFVAAASAHRRFTKVQRQAAGLGRQASLALGMPVALFQHLCMWVALHIDTIRIL
jgi:uncharacterized protein (DUF3084 family)